MASHADAGAPEKQLTTKSARTSTSFSGSGVKWRRVSSLLASEPVKAEAVSTRRAASSATSADALVAAYQACGFSASHCRARSSFHSRLARRAERLAPPILQGDA